MTACDYVLVKYFYISIEKISREGKSKTLLFPETTFKILT